MSSWVSDIVLYIWAYLLWAGYRHQGPASPDGEEGIGISEQEFDRVSKENVERWVSAHIIPVNRISISFVC